ncbi:hypothetical protein [Pseudomonas haemolytica]|uniref:Uncharacterized protein n=1 Tax=Pseudomonas haemolytica TaxID=2600065 RepID=A0A5P1DG89_9PSED|nr:hypothetical protein [Pseudomonas haemolytica]MBJ2248254.1 hypothetical protein [Pseudomonas haemolytica]MBJ2275849.1 hypothetical protein [Pseudomonas haemolytica]MBK3451212.1 hypothetical protein [Pseudomonas haemolytica]MBK3459931.1 hypothetical protein [Pseudomonas haemolytica]MRJ20803.1 hypothetical protein [Pseudomonas haemolytica]
MNAPAPAAPSSLRYLAAGVLCVAVLLGFYFVQLNAKVDRQREEAVERLALCRHMERAAGTAKFSNEEFRETCQQLRDQLFKSATPL